MSVFEPLISYLQNDYPNWKITYDKQDEKFVFTTEFNGIRLSPEEIEHLKKAGLEIFSIYKTKEFLSIQFVSTGGSLY